MDVSRPTVGNQTPAQGPPFGLTSWLPGRVAQLRAALAGAALATGITTVAVAQPPAARHPAAILLPPQRLDPADTPPVARGAIDDTPDMPLGTTPVRRTGAKSPAASGPAWLSGVDPNVLPAAGKTGGDVRPAGGVAPAPRPFSFTAQPGIPPTVPFKGFEKTKATPGAAQPGGPTTPHGGESGLPADASTPLRGMATNGAPVLAGPPAYRWYGYGSVTPGANTFAPAGQYPKASANWFSVTGATPGAFPVPVMNPYRQAPGSEPPTYPVTGTARGPAVRPPTQSPPTAIGGLPTVPVHRSPAGVGGSATPPVVAPRRDTSTPVVAPRTGMMSAPPTSGMIAPDSKFPISHQVGVPALVQPPGVAASSPPVATSGLPEIPSLPPVPPVRTAIPASHPPLLATKPAAPSGPAPLPVSLTDEVRWQSSPDAPSTAEPGTWMPVPSKPRGPAVPSMNPGSGPGAVNTAALRSVARGQMPDAGRPDDPAIALIGGICHARAEGLDVRWAGSKKLMVCFEVRGEPDATRLVKDICARPELAPLQIDFCVVVK